MTASTTLIRFYCIEAGVWGRQPLCNRSAAKVCECPPRHGTTPEARVPLSPPWTTHHGPGPGLIPSRSSRDPDQEGGRGRSGAEPWTVRSSNQAVGDRLHSFTKLTALLRQISPFLANLPSNFKITWSEWQSYLGCPGLRERERGLEVTGATE